jgi:hypothetical protein
MVEAGGRMSGFDDRDKIPMAAAVLVVVLGNVVGYSLRVTVFMSILAAPLAILAFMTVRYALYGNALPEVLTRGT